MNQLLHNTDIIFLNFTLSRTFEILHICISVASLRHQCASRAVQSQSGSVSQLKIQKTWNFQLTNTTT